MSGLDPLPSQHQDIPSDIRAQLEARGISADDRLIALIQVVLNVTQARGTMVAVDEIERWQSLVPDAGERMMRRVEVEQIHRHGLQRLVMYTDFGLKSFAQLIGLIGSLAGMYVAYLLVSAGFGIPGAAIGIAALGYPTMALALVGRKLSNSATGQAER